MLATYLRDDHGETSQSFTDQFTCNLMQTSMLYMYGQQEVGYETDGWLKPLM